MCRSGRLLLSIKKEVSGNFSFTCPVTALPVSYRRRLTLCTALSTSPPGHPGLPATTCIYVVGLLPVELNVLFILVLSFLCPRSLNIPQKNYPTLRNFLGSDRTINKMMSAALGKKKKKKKNALIIY